ncbi:MAG TPA: hypothetical protein PL166_11880 [Candidatus Contendobacter sp.]|nr:hypothetical protein [Candidatus Contendobacter sp.]
MAFRISTKLKNVMLDAIRTGPGSLLNGVIYVYSGSQPVDADAAPTGTLLGKITVGAGAFSWGSPTNGVDFDAAAGATLNKAAAETWQFVGLANGVAGWFRHMGNAADSLTTDGSATYPRIDGRIATTGAEMNLSNLDIAIGATTTVDTYSIAWPAGF